jgi:hypothetical protein
MPTTTTTTTTISPSTSATTGNHNNHQTGIVAVKVLTNTPWKTVFQTVRTMLQTNINQIQRPTCIENMVDRAKHRCPWTILIQLVLGKQQQQRLYLQHQNQQLSMIWDMNNKIAQQVRVQIEPLVGVGP